MEDAPRTISELIKEISFLKQRIQELEQSESERKQTEEAMHQARRPLDEIIEFLPDATFVIDADGRVISWNNAIEQMTGVSKEDMIGKGNYEYAIPFYGQRRPLLIDLALLQDKDFERNHYEGVYRQGDTLYAEAYVPQLYKGKGASLWGTSSKLRDTFGNIFGAIESIRDITEHKQAEEELRRMNAFLDSIVENIPNMIFLKDARELRFVRFNRAGEELLGHSRNDLLGKNDYDFFPKEQANFFTQKDREVLRGKDVVDIPEETIQTHFQGERTLHTKKVPILNNNGKPEYLLGISEDITSRKHAEEEITREREKLKTLSDNAPFGMILMDKEGHFTYINRKFTELFGYDLSDIPDGRTWCRKAYPDAEYRQRVISAWREDLGDAKPGEQKNIFTVTGKDGTQKIIQFIFSVLISGDYLMTCEDITERKRMEEAIQYQNLLFTTQQEASVDGILVVDDQGTVLSYNRRFVEIWGIPSEVLKTRVDEQLLQAVVCKLARPEEFLRKVKYLYGHQQETSRDEIALADGRVLDRYSAAVVGDEGKYYGRIWYFRDVTEQKQILDALKLRERELIVKSKTLEEVNTALRVLLDQREKDKNELEDKILFNVRKLVLPYVDALKQRHLDEDQRTYLDVLETNLNNIISPFAKKLTSIHESFTPAEIRVADFIRDGKTVKEIAKTFGVSESAVNLHRQHIRNKLGLNNQKINLRTYLMSLQ